MEYFARLPVNNGRSLPVPCLIVQSCQLHPQEARQDLGPVTVEAIPECLFLIPRSRKLIDHLLSSVNRGVIMLETFSPFGNSSRKGSQ